jgi:predicted metal-dependent HD superfamily phosphohydrolase
MDESRFARLWKKCVPSRDGSAAAAVYRTLRGYYSEPWRCYHTLSHLRHCLGELDEVAHLLDAPEQVEMALWFHDVIYVPGAGDNEARSVELFDGLLGGAVSPAFARRIRELIMATCHYEPPATGDERYVVDIDLASFGLPWKAFIHDSEKVRAEALHLTESEFLRNQLAFLRRLLSRPHFYSTPYFRRKYEAQARENLSRKIADLTVNSYT